MDTQTLWVLAMSIATPIAGIIGFAIQLRQVRKVRLENRKLLLEIAALQQRAMESERRIVLATNKEVQEITRGEVRFSRVGEAEVLAKPKPKIKDRLIIASVFAVMALFLVYLVYDLYRLVIWLETRL